VKLPLFNRSISVELQTNTSLILIKDLKIDFECDKNEKSDTNTCKIKIFNMSNSTIDKIKDIDVDVTLKAGYLDFDGEEVLFKGNLTTLFTMHPKPNRVTSIVINDGEKQLNEALSSMAFKEGTSVKQVLNEAIKNLGLPLKTKLSSINFKDLKFNNAFSFGGLTKTLMDEVTKMIGLQWSVQNQELKLYLEDTIDKSLLTHISSNSGMIGSPEKIKIKRGKRKKKKEIDGWRIISLLQPKLEPGGTVSITSRDIPSNSLFRIFNVKHVGSKYEGDFQTTIEVAKYE